MDSEILINDGDGFFFRPLNATQTLTGGAFEVGDFDGDDKIDVLAWGGENLLLFSGADGPDYPLVGTGGDDNLHGDAFDNDMLGDVGSDSIGGGAGKDGLDGDIGDDILKGGSGDDTITGGAGRDTMDGGLGADDFVFNLASDTGNDALTRDIITGFKHLEDDIDVSAIASFAWRAKAAFTGTGPELRYLMQDLKGSAKDKTIIQADLDGNGGVDFQIQLKGLIKLTADDFIL
jgi:Ca2+-binding RTX toxin-like protein